MCFSVFCVCNDSRWWVAFAKWHFSYAQVPLSLRRASLLPCKVPLAQGIASAVCEAQQQACVLASVLVR